MNLGEQKSLLIEAGFTNTEVDDWEKEKVLTLKSAGFNNQQIKEEFGFINNNEKTFLEYFQNISKEMQEQSMQEEIIGPDDQFQYDSMQNRGDEKTVKEFLFGKKFDGDEILKRGWGKTLFSLTERLINEKGLPEVLVNENDPKDYTWLEGLMEHALTLGSDLPLYALSALPGVAIGGPYTGAFTAGAIPGAARETIIKGLEQQSYGQPIEVLKNFLTSGVKEGAKQGVIFTSTAVAPQLKIAGTKLAEKYATRVLSQLSAFEGVGALLNGQLPSLRDFSYSAVLFGALGVYQPKGVVENRTKKIFITTGKKPNEVFNDAVINKRVLEDVSSREYVRDYKNLEDRKTIIKEKKPKETEVLFKDDLANKASENIVFKSKVEPLSKERLLEIGSKVKRKSIIEGIDQKYPILEALRAAKVNTKTGIEKLNIYEQARLLEGIPNRAAYFIENNTINFKNLNDKGAGLKTVTEPVIKQGKNETQLFETYLMNRRALELNERGLESGFNIEVAKQFVNQNKSKFEKTAKGTDKYQLELMEYARDGGIISAKDFKAMTEANKNYVTFARELISDGKAVVAEGTVNPFKKIEGSKLRVFPPLEQMVKNTNLIVNLVEKNRVRVNFIDKVIEARKSNPNILKDVIYKDNPKTTKSPKEDLMIIIRDGKRETWNVGKDLANAFKTLDQQGSNMLWNFASAPAKTLRAGAILIPDFAVPNFFRDTMQASFLNKVGFVPIQDSLIGMFKIITKGNNKKAMAMYKKYVKSGGMQSTLLAVDRPNLFDGKVYDILSKGPVRNADKGMLAPLRALTRLSEEMTRFRIFEKTYRKAIDKGLTERQALERAGFEARNLLDYAKRGTLGNNINRLVPFWNARVQGLTRLYEAFRDNPGRTTAMIGAYVVIPTLTFYMLNYDDPDYKEQPEWLKQNYYYFKIFDKQFRFPKPFEVGTLVSSIVEKTLDYIRTNEPQEFDRFAKDFFINNAKGFYPIPTVVRPFIENFMDYSFFRDAPIIPKSLDKNLLQKFYYTEYTSETFKLYSKIINGLVGDDSFLATKPLHAENVFRSWTGGLGRYLIDIMDFVLIKGKIIDDPIKPTDTLSKIPVVRAFDVRDVPGYSAKSLVRFFEEYEDIQKILSSMDFAFKQGNLEEYAKLKATLKVDEAVIVQYRESIRELDKKIRQIYNTKELADGTIITADEKRELIDMHYMLMINFAQQALKYLDSIRKQ
tara:strand:+ start:1775 stop:5413 length:3639 start_codon:yes stop_codon:yes gene_type:complete